MLSIEFIKNTLGGIDNLNEKTAIISRSKSQAVELLAKGSIVEPFPVMNADTKEWYNVNSDRKLSNHEIDQLKNLVIWLESQHALIEDLINLSKTTAVSERLSRKDQTPQTNKGEEVPRVNANDFNDTANKTKYKHEIVKSGVDATLKDLRTKDPATTLDTAKRVYATNTRDSFANVNRLYYYKKKK